MNPRNTWLLVALAAGLFAFIWLIEPRLRPPPPVALKVMPAFKAAEVTSVQIQPKGQLAVRVERTNGTWLMTRPLVYPVKPGAVDNFLQALEGLSPHTRISGEELRKLRNVSEEYGFDTPEATIILEFGDDKRTLHLGNRTAMRDELYTQLVGMDSVDVIGADFLKFVPRSADDWRDTSFVNLAGMDFDRLAVVHGGQTLELARNATNKLWRMTKPAVVRADNTRIETLLNNLQNLRVNTFVTDNPAAELEPYGLQPPQSELTFSQGTNRLFSLQFGASPSNDTSLVYARSNAGSTIVLLPKEFLAGWWANPNDFRERHLLDIATDPPDLIEVSGTNAENFTVRLTNGIWKILDAQKLEYAADPALMRGFLKNLADLQVNVQGDKYTVRDVAVDTYLTNYGLAPQPGRSYILRYPGPPASTNEVDFGSPTNNDCILAKRADESAVVAVLADAVNQLPTRALQLRDRRAWYFDAGEVTRLTIRNKGITQIWEHTGPRDWNSPTPNGKLLENRETQSLLIEEAVGNLGELRVQRWIECGDTNRAKYGIDDTTPRISLDVKRGEASKTFSIEFGRAVPLEEGGGIYASVPVLEGQNWTNWIIVYSASDVHNLLDWLPGLSR